MVMEKYYILIFSGNIQTMADPEGDDETAAVITNVCKLDSFNSY